MQMKIMDHLYVTGSSPAAIIAEGLGLHRTNIYDCLNQLISKGLVSYIDTSGAKNFTAVDKDVIFRRVTEILEEARETIIPHKHDSDDADVKVRVFTGLSAVQDLLNEFLTIKSSIDIFGVPLINERGIIGIINRFHERRMQLKIPMRHLYAGAATSRIAELNTMPFTEARASQSAQHYPITTIISGSLVVLHFWNRDPLLVRIDSMMLADSYKRYFELAWQTAK